MGLNKRLLLDGADIRHEAPNKRSLAIALSKSAYRPFFIIIAATKVSIEASKDEIHIGSW